MAKFRTAWWQLWRPKPCIEIPCPPFESIRLEAQPIEGPSVEAAWIGYVPVDPETLRPVEDFRDEWPPSWTDDASAAEPVQADLAEREAQHDAQPVQADPAEPEDRQPAADETP
jgi:hypothetical protein